MKCSKCGSEDVTLYEYRWAYDGWLIRGCNSCWTRELRDSGYYVLISEQIEEYWALCTIARNDEGDIKKFVNMRPYEEPFIKKDDKYTLFFNRLMEWLNVM